MAKSKTKQSENKNIEREYVIPLREGFRKKAIYKKTPAAVKTIKSFLVRHMKIRDRDLKKIKVNKYLNEYLWFRGIKKPPAKVKVRAVKEEAGTENEKVRVYLKELPEKLNFKQKRENKLLKSSEEKQKTSAKEASAKASAKGATDKQTEKTETKEEIVKDIKESGVSEEVAKKEEQLDEEATKKAEEIEKKEKDLDKKETKKAEKKSSKKTSSKKSSKKE